ncbi:lytic polysaccharide monooxygenase [Streptomyces sp. NPDC002784]
MTRTRARRALAAAVPPLLALGAATPAAAHGAPTDPVSRVLACSPEGGSAAGSAACRAAVAANGTPFTAWDNLRIANVNGQDRRIVPDGQLCSGGLPAYRGLDLPRSDWPSTRLRPGAGLTLRYVSTIPHTGTFRLYLTRQGYDPTRPLTWSDLPERPLAEVRDPALTDGAYRIRATLPADRTGRHVLYTVWQNSSTPDTYYSCSDVEFPAKEKDLPPNEKSLPPNEKDLPPKEKGLPVQDRAEETAKAAAPSPPAPGQRRTAAVPAPDPGPSAPLLAGGAAAVLLLIGGAAVAVRLRRR